MSSIPTTPGVRAIDVGPLSWVIEEVRASLGNAVAAIKAYAANTQESTQLRFAKTYLHQAHGALQIVDLDGVSMLTEQVERVLDRIEDDPRLCDASTVALVERVFNGLLDYLDDLLAGAPHQPIRLFPHYRDLLALLKAERVHPADLLYPDTSVRVADEAPYEALAADKLGAARVRFERGLLKFLRDLDRKAGVDEMGSAIRSLRGAQARGAHRSFWTVMDAMLASLPSQGPAPDLNLKRLCARLNLQMRRTLEGSQALPERLLKDALFYVAASESESPAISNVRQAYALEGAVPQDYQNTRYGRVDAQVIKRARDALGSLKGAWDRLMGGQVSEAAAVQRQAQTFADQVRVLTEPGLTQLASCLQEIAQQCVQARGVPSADLGIETATALLFLESTLETFNRLDAGFTERADLIAQRLRSVKAGIALNDSVEWMADLSRKSHERSTMASLVGEIQTNLRAIEQSLDAFFRDPGKREGLNSADALLNQTSGALLMLDQQSASAALEFGRAAIARFLQPGYAPDQREFERVAQTFGALGFFVDALRQPDNVSRPTLEFDPHEGAYVARIISERHSAGDNRGFDAVTDNDRRQPTIPAILRTQARVSQEAEAAEQEVPAAQRGANEPLLDEGEAAKFDRTIAMDFGTRAEDISTADLKEDAPALTSFDGIEFGIDKTDSFNFESPELDATSVERETQEHARRAIQLVELLQTGLPDDAALAELRSELTEVRQGAELLDDARLLAAARNAIALASGTQFDVGSLAALRSTLADFFDKPGKDAPAPDASTLALAASDDSVIDAELLSIFLGEAREVFEAIADARDKSISAPANQDHLTTLRRSFHTLKGSSRMVGLRVFGEAAFAIEQVLNLWLAEERSGTPAVYALVASAQGQMSGWVERIDAGDHRAVRPEALIAAAERVKAGGDFFLSAESGEFDAPGSATLTPEHEAAFSESLSFAPLDLTDAEAVEAPEALAPDQPRSLAQAEQDLHALAPDHPMLPAAETSIETEAIRKVAADLAHGSGLDFEIDEVVDLEKIDTEVILPLRIGDLSISPQLYQIYLAEAESRLRAAEEDFALWRMDPARPVSEMAIRSVHSLAGASATAGVTPVHDLAVFLEQTLLALERAPVRLLYDELHKLDFIIERLRGMLHQFAAGVFPVAEPGALAAVDELRNAWALRHQGPLHLEVVSSSQSEPGAAPHVEVAPNAEAEALAPLLPAAPSLEADARPVQQWEISSTDAVRQRAGDENAAQGIVDLRESAAAVADELDLELLDLFVSEAGDHLPSMGSNLAILAKDPGNALALEDLQRHLHTVKGSARMAGAMRLGALLHGMESLLLGGTDHGSSFYEGMLERFDDAVTLFDGLTRGESVPLSRAEASPQVANAPIQVSSEFVPDAAPGTESGTESGIAAEHAYSASPVVQSSNVMPFPLPATAVAPAALAAAAAAPLVNPATTALADSHKARLSALVRVRSDVLDRLVNQAGEVSIARSRLENDLQGVRGSLGDLTENVTRLRGQLREIEIAAEAQLQTRMEQQREVGADFDPLEFDRYTRLQELTRMMAESVNDVAMVQQNIVRSLEGANKDITNQARLTRDLQQDLMRVRMVPVDSVSDRLYRVVRQSAKETGKRVNLNIVGANVELDRGVLERMAGPFEHLLRNAVVHGIESADQRARSGKSEVGQIGIAVRQEGNEVLLEFADDGAGLDLDRIRAKGFERGMLPAPDAVDDAEAAELIFAPGFSTANEVTELAGRGVGMDVVRTEAASLGGRVEIQTVAGQGSRFSIRLPLTLAVTQVVLVRAGERVFAMPSVLVEQVQQLRPNVIATAYNDGNVLVLGERIEFAYLPALLGDYRTVPTAQRYSPVIAVRAGGRRLALHVDEVIGNQEVVVKNIGPQLARMIGIAGATVLGSGEIVLILNPVQLVGRVDTRHAPRPELPTSTQVSAGMATQVGAVGNIIEGAQPPRTEISAMTTAPVVMVVDDSVTVRRVTQRLLLREGYQVVLAKDGVDALEQLQDFAPDIMLVDIEMPRMDGFDLTRNVRSDNRFKKIPIVMITSRTADKHRNMAFSLGVNVYLGKPYQEHELIETITRFVGHRELNAQ